MKWIARISYLIFLTGFLLKFFHIHYNAIMMMAGIAGLLIFVCVSMIRKETRNASLPHLVIMLWLTHLFTIVKFFPVADVFMWLASGASVVYGISIIRQKKAIPLVSILSVAAVAIYMRSMPISDRYRVLNISRNYEAETDYITWDKYSWFLYRDGRYEDAMEASDKALEIAGQIGSAEWVQLIGEHNKSIAEKSWVRYR